MSLPAPDLKPHVPPAPPGSEACGGCDGITAETPQGLDNRPGLSALAYRIGDHAQFRASVHASLSSSQFAALARLRTRDDADFTIGLIDAFACAADVLTFYSERIANESYLRSATERISLQELGKLVGYRLRPGLAAEAWLAFALETPPPPPPKLPPEPGNFVTGVPHSVTLDTGLQVQSVPGPGEKPQTFETVEPLAEARAAWNAMQPWLSAPRVPISGDTEVWLAGTALNLKPGDALLFVGKDFLQDPSSWDFRLLTAVEPDNDAVRTRVAWARGLKAVFPASDPSRQPVVYALRKRAAVFGHNAPLWRSMSDDFRTAYTQNNHGDPKGDDWPDFVVSPAGQSGSGGNIDLDSVQPQIAVDIAAATDPARRSFAVVAKGDFNQPDGIFSKDTFVDLYRVTNTIEVSRAQFALSAKVTRLALAGNHLDTVFFDQVRETSVFAQSELLPLAERPVSDPVTGDMVPVAVGPDGLLPGRRLIVRGKRASDKAAVICHATLVTAHPETDNAAHCTLEIDPAVADELDRDSVVVHGNVVLASHGETVSQILGAGNASSPFQHFELKQLPLTWRGAENETGAKSELTVRVNDVAWTERETLFGAAPTERAYTLEVDEQGRNFVAFGDGVRGARLPSGVNNVRASYRKGLGAGGNVAADKLTQLITRPLGLKSVSNPLATEGGTDPEPEAAAQQSIPLTTRTLGRAVSLLDYEDFARGFSGIAKARAQVLALPAGATIAITIAGPDGALLTAASPVWTNLLAALRKNGDPHVAVMLLSAQLSTFRLGLTVKRDPAFDVKSVLAAVETALRAHFAFAPRGLGQPVQQSDVVAVAQAVPGVVAVDITRLYGGTQPPAQTNPSTQVRLLASRMHVEAGVAQPAELLTLDPAPLDILEEMA